MDTATYAVVSTSVVDTDDVSLVANDAQLDAGRFCPAWIEDWAWREAAGDLAIAPRDHCALDVSFDESLFECPMSDIMPSDGFMLQGSCANTGLGVIAQSNTSLPQAISIEAVSPSISTLEEWYSETYTKGLLAPSPDFGHIVDGLASICCTPALAEEPNAVLARLISLLLLNSAAIEDVFESVELACSASELGEAETFHALRHRMAHSVGGDGPNKRAWQVRECKLQILLHLFAIDQLRLQKTGEVSQLEESLRDLVDLLCVWASLDDIAMNVEVDVTTSSNQKADKAESINDIAAAFVGGPHVGRFASSLGDLVEELRIQCGWVPPATRNEQSEHPDLLSESRRRKGTPRKISKSSGERSEVIVHQRKPAHQELSGRKLARHLDELIGGGLNRSVYHDDASSSEGGSSPLLRAAERR
ncbi:hypothetical protein GGI21_005710, partial [Coemansia aciculifera]